MARRKDNIVYNLLNTYTGEWQTFVDTTTWIDGSAMNDSKCDGTIFRKKGTGYLKLNWTGPVNVRWFGAKGDGVTNDTPFVQAAIDAFQTGTTSKCGASILFPAGTYLLNGLVVKSGTKLYADQNAKDNDLANVSTIIKAFGTPSFIIDCDATATNIAIENLYINCDYVNQPNLTAGVRLRGTKVYFTGNNIRGAAGHAVYSSAGLVYIEKNSILGMFDPSFTFSSLNDFKGSLHIESIGDSYVYDNEISASLPYFTSVVNPRDPVNGRIVAMSIGANGFGGTSIIAGNLFENGDRAVAIGNSLYCNWHNNRYELSAMGGMYIFGPAQFCSFSQERFADNSLVTNGGADDITIAVGAAGNISFISPTFESLVNVDIPNSGFKVNYHISNYGSDLVELITPLIDTVYSVNGLINLSGPTLLPVRQVKGQYDPDNPRYTSVTTEKLPAASNQVGFSKIKQGSTIAGGSLVGAIEFWTPQKTLAYHIGFSPKEYLSFQGYETNPIFAFNGHLSVQKNGEAKTTIWSADGAGHSSLILQNFPTVTQQATLRLNKDTGVFELLSSGNISVGPSNNWLFETSGYSSIPTLPAQNLGTNYKILVRNDTTGRVEYTSGVTTNYTFSNTGFTI